MTSIQDPVLKIKLLKKYLKHPDKIIQNILIQASTIGEIWSLLFKHNLFDLYSEIIAAGIYPTSNEMNEIQYSNHMGAWYWLAAHRHSVFMDLLDKDILPNAQALSVCNTSDNTNVWYWVAKGDGRTRKTSPIFCVLLNKNILPNTQDLSARELNDNTNTWHFLTRSPARIKVFLKLLTKGILPNAQDLSVCDTHNCNVWYRLAESDRFGDRYSNGGIAVFNDLLLKDIVPDSHALSVFPTDTKTNTWQVLARRTNANIIFNRFKSLQQLENTYNLKPQNQVTILLSREHIETFYGFLYLLYLDSKKPQISTDIWLMIGKCLLPNAMYNKSLMSDENRSTFVKHYMLNSLTNKRDSFFSSHKNRALGLKKAIKESSHPEAILLNQYYMSQRTDTPYSRNSTLEHQQPFNPKDRDPNFNSLLQEGYFLSKPHNQQRKNTCRSTYSKKRRLSESEGNETHNFVRKRHELELC
jgi:hypothetical protein